MARHRRGGGRGGSILGMHMPGGNKYYVEIGIFTLLFVVYLWIAPKLIKKPAGTPPRSGSNEETQQANRTASGMTPEPVGAPGTAPNPPIAAPSGSAGGGSGLGGGLSVVGSGNTLGGPLPATTGGQSSSYGVGRIGGYRARAMAAFPYVGKISYQ